MIVTEGWIKEHSTSDRVGSWNNAQLKAIGCSDKSYGWIARMEGKKITDEQKVEFESYAYWKNKAVDSTGELF